MGSLSRTGNNLCRPLRLHWYNLPVQQDKSHHRLNSEQLIQRTVLALSSMTTTMSVQCQFKTKISCLYSTKAIFGNCQSRIDSLVRKSWLEISLVFVTKNPACSALPTSFAGLPLWLFTRILGSLSCIVTSKTTRLVLVAHPDVPIPDFHFGINTLLYYHGSSADRVHEHSSRQVGSAGFPDTIRRWSRSGSCLTGCMELLLARRKKVFVRTLRGWIHP